MFFFFFKLAVYNYHIYLHTVKNLSQSEAGGMKMLHLSLDGYKMFAGWLTANAIDHERVQLLLAMFTLARQVRHGLDFPMKQVVQQG